MKKQTDFLTDFFEKKLEQVKEHDIRDIVGEWYCDLDLLNQELKELGLNDILNAINEIMGYARYRCPNIRIVKEDKYIIYFYVINDNGDEIEDSETEIMQFKTEYFAKDFLKNVGAELR